MIRILAVDDENVILKSFETAFSKHRDKFEIVTAASGEEALGILEKDKFDLMFTDMKMPGISGLELLKTTRSRWPEMDVVLITGYASVDSAVETMKFGALDYITKPFTNAELFSHVERILSLREKKLREKEEASGFIRFSFNIRVQHILMMISFTLLTITGLPLLLPQLFKNAILLSDTSTFRGILHRIAGVSMIILSFYHILYVVFTEDGHNNLRLILPKFPKDIKDAIHLIMYNLGLKKYPPRFGKYDFIEKFEYFAVVWGTLIMVVSGIILWMASDIMGLFPVWVVDVARIVHHYEAILAILSIFIWHMYTVHWKPGVFPMSYTWLDGKISRDDLIHHHPEEYERITGRKIDFPESQEA